MNALEWTLTKGSLIFYATTRGAFVISSAIKFMTFDFFLASRFILHIAGQVERTLIKTLRSPLSSEFTRHCVLTVERRNSTPDFFLGPMRGNKSIK